MANDQKSRRFDDASAAAVYNYFLIIIAGASLCCILRKGPTKLYTDMNQYFIRFDCSNSVIAL